MRVLIFDSGLGGLTVYRELKQSLPSAHFIYAADDAGFPYGAWAADDLVWRVLSVMRALVATHKPDAAVIACNTAATLALPHVRAAFPNIPFIGTVPAIKPAAERTQSGMISVLATPGTVARDYTHDLIARFARHCQVALVGSKNLAPLAEAFMKGGAISDEDIASEIAPCFVTAEDGRRTDHIVLACTHYPLLLEQFRRLSQDRPAFWPVSWIDPAPAIARHTAKILGVSAPAGEGYTPDLSSGGEALRDHAVFTSGAAQKDSTIAALARFGIALN